MAGRSGTGFIYTAGAKEEMVKKMGFDRNVQLTEMAMARIFGSCESVFVTDTLQFDDYSKYVSTLFDAEEKKKNTGRRSSRRTAKKHTSSGHGWSGREREIFRSWCRHAL